MDFRFLCCQDIVDAAGQATRSERGVHYIEHALPLQVPDANRGLKRILEHGGLLIV